MRPADSGDTGRVTGVSLLRARCVRAQVVREVVREHAVKALCVHHDHVIEAVASDRADDAFRVGVLPRRPRRYSHRLHVHAGDGSRDAGKDRIAIVNQISRRFILRKGIAQLLRGPSRRRMLGDRHVNDSPTVVREDDKYEEQPERDRWHDKEAGGHDLARVIRQEGAPRL
jgi:hypothetical protein